MENVIENFLRENNFRFAKSQKLKFYKSRQNNNFKNFNLKVGKSVLEEFFFAKFFGKMFEKFWRKFYE